MQNEFQEQLAKDLLEEQLSIQEEIKKQTMYKNTDLVRRVLAYPFKLVIMLLVVPLAFFVTDFTDEFERKFYFKTIRQLYTF